MSYTKFTKFWKDISYRVHCCYITFIKGNILHKMKAFERFKNIIQRKTLFTFFLNTFLMILYNKYTKSPSFFQIVETSFLKDESVTFLGKPKKKKQAWF